jgi:signal transduction histidine kinase
MQQFVAGFVVALLVVVPIAFLLLRKKASGTSTNKDGHLKELENLSKLTGELAHEIKNPLSTIKINLKLVSEELEDSNFAESGRKSADKNGQRFTRALRKIGVIQKETDRLEQILDGFLRYVDKTELQLASVDVNELIRYREPLICKIDADMLKQAILNLFINAQQAMSDGGELLIRTDRQKEDAVIQISDTGTGIAPDKLPNIFDAYYSSRPRGSGLGLPTTKKIVEAHNGTIAVNSEPGKGTSFTIRLPVQRE